MVWTSLWRVWSALDNVELDELPVEADEPLEPDEPLELDEPLGLDEPFEPDEPSEPVVPLGLDESLVVLFETVAEAVESVAVLPDPVVEAWCA
jgi:hypothetical protein